MYKHLLRFSTLILFISIFISIYILINITFKNNTLLISPNDYSKILDEVHSNIDKYVGTKIVVSGYAYIQEDFLKNNFVIAQNVFMNSEELIIGFLCENCTKTSIKSNENITITGKIEKCMYNNLQYPIIKVTKIT